MSETNNKPPFDEKLKYISDINQLINYLAGQKIETIPVSTPLFISLIVMVLATLSHDYDNENFAKIFIILIGLFLGWLWFRYLKYCDYQKTRIDRKIRMFIKLKQNLSSDQASLIEVQGNLTEYTPLIFLSFNQWLFSKGKRICPLLFDSSPELGKQ